MAADYNEKQRPALAKLDGKGPYIITELNVTERVSGRSDYVATIVSGDKLSESCLGKTFDVRYSPGFEGDRKEVRAFLALTSSIENIGFDVANQLYRYRVEAIDPLSVFAFRTTSRTFQEMSTKQIVEEVLSDSGLKSYFKVSPRSSGITHTYCIQFNESDLEFLMRMMASEGWHYHCDHTGSQPSVVIADSNQDFNKANDSKVPFITNAKDKTFSITQWGYRNQIGASKLSLADHTQELAECLSSGDRNTTSSIKNSALTQYFFGQGNQDKSAIRDAAKRQMESIDSQKVIAIAHSSIPTLGAGLRFSLTDHTESEYNQEYLITQAEHSIQANESGMQAEYQNRIHCVPTTGTWRPPFIKKPRIYSVQSAEVTGPSGEEVNQDKSARIKVQFHWDQDGKKDEKSSCWVPVAQAVASNGFGVQFIPRIGDEVLVSFIDGDPDRPVVSGSIYNGKNKPPYTTATQSGIKTRTTPNGSSTTANELRFEDKKDKEEVFLQAEKDLTINVKNDSKQTITGISSTEVEKTTDWKSKEAMTLATEDAFSASAKKDVSLKADANFSADAGKNADISATSAVSVDGQTIKISGKTSIKLAVGGSSIELSQSGIKISGPQIAISGQAKAEMKATMVTVEGQGKADIKGTMITINGSAMTQVKAGAMVQIQGAIAKVN